MWRKCSSPHLLPAVNARAICSCTSVPILFQSVCASSTCQHVEKVEYLQQRFDDYNSSLPHHVLAYTRLLPGFFSYCKTFAFLHKNCLSVKISPQSMGQRKWNEKKITRKKKKRKNMKCPSSITWIYMEQHVSNNRMGTPFRPSFFYNVPVLIFFLLNHATETRFQFQKVTV